MEQPQKSAAKSKTERDRTLRRVNKRRVVQAQLRDRGFQMFEVASVDRINPAEYHRMNFLEARQRFARRIALIRDRVADLHVGGGFDVGDEIPDVAGFKSRLHKHLRRKHADFLHFVARIVAHQLDRMLWFHVAGHNAHVTDNTSINIEH